MRLITQLLGFEASGLYGHMAVNTELNTEFGADAIYCRVRSYRIVKRTRIIHQLTNVIRWLYKLMMLSWIPNGKFPCTLRCFFGFEAPRLCGKRHELKPKWCCNSNKAHTTVIFMRSCWQCNATCTVIGMVIHCDTGAKPNTSVSERSVAS